MVDIATKYGNSVKSVQSGTFLAQASATTSTVSITSVNTAKSFVLHQGGGTVNGTETFGYGTYAVLTNATTVSVTNKMGGGTMNTAFTVVEFY